MSAITKICHLADIHLRRVPTRNEEYIEVFNGLINSLKDTKPDRIIIVGDLVNDYLNLDSEQLVIAHDFLNSLADIAPVRITRGNHDCLKTNLNRKDSVHAIVETLKNPNVVYYNSSGFFEDENVIWVVWNHGEKNNNPWLTREGKKILKTLNKETEKTYIDLFHDPISGGLSDTGFELKSKRYYKVGDFKGHYLMAGDIHKKQYLNKEKTKAYCGSLIAQKFSEGDDSFHGYLLWDIDKKNVDEVPIYNKRSFKNIILSQYTDFDDLDIEIENPTEEMLVRFLWKTLPSLRNKENERKLSTYIKSKYSNIKISNKNEFLEEDEHDTIEADALENITTKDVQHEILKNYLEKIGTESKTIEEILNLDDEVVKMIDEPETINTEWDVIKFGGTNFMSYEKFDVDWRDMDGIFQIVGNNASGKTTIIFKFFPYMFYGKTPETETRPKFGDVRYVNNKNGADFCEGYVVLEINDEIFGIKKRTDVVRNRAGEITSSPTKMSYYLLNSPDDEMGEENNLEKFDEERRQKTEKKLLSVIGSYDDFMRTILTTSDSLNKILSNDMAVFIDSLLYESGLDVFDKKLEAVKSYEKKVNELGRITCNVESNEEKIKNHKESIKIINNTIAVLKDEKLPEVETSIKKGNKYVEDLIKKLHKIDDEIYKLNVEDAKKDITQHEKEKKSLEDQKMGWEKSIVLLKETYDSEKLEELEKTKSEHKTTEFEHKLKIRECEQNKSLLSNSIEVIRGEIKRLKESGKDLKDEILDLKESKTCSQCGQELTDEHKSHMLEKIKGLEEKMFKISKEIKEKENRLIPDIEEKIKKEEKTAAEFTKKIADLNIKMDGVLAEIGEITNDKNDVEKRKEIQSTLNSIPAEIKNHELEIKILEEKVKRHENSLIQIKENQDTEKIITTAKEKLKSQEESKTAVLEEISDQKALIVEKEREIKNIEETIEKFKEQERRDSLIATYKKCVHRNGIPKQLLTAHVIPKTNRVLEDVLVDSQFKVWLDAEDLRPKLAYNNTPEAVIDCISASGKERTFSSIVLKYALNQNNIKSRPKFFLLDEIMGKLDEKSVEEFVEILHTIRAHMKRIVIVEHVHQINPDYVINVFITDGGISEASIT
jgi:DNA repair exonuclease SbcCD ATPase subunit